MASAPGDGFHAPEKSSVAGMSLDADLQMLLKDLASVTIIDNWKNAATQTDCVGENVVGPPISRGQKTRPRSQNFDLSIVDDDEVSTLKLELQEERNAKAILETKIAELRRKVGD